MAHSHLVAHRQENTHMEVMQEELSKAKTYDSADYARILNMKNKDTAYLREARLILRAAHRKSCYLLGT